MRIFIILFAFILSVSAKPLTVIGASGTEYSVRMSDGDANLNDLFYHLQMRNGTNGDTLFVRYNKSALRLITGSKTAFYNDSAVTIDSSLRKAKGNYWLSPKPLAQLLSLLTRMDFRLVESTNTISIHKVTTEYEELSGVVVIDPGHGGKDPGAIGQDSTFEKDVVLSISLKTAEFLEKNSSLTVHLTRNDDTFIPLRDRTNFANDKKADLFVSVHANSSPKMDKIGGYKMYFLSDAKNEADERIAKFENEALAYEDNGPELDILQTVLKDMINNEFLKESQDLSIDLEESFSETVATIEPLHTGVGQANFFVLNGALMPSVLVEACFISNKDEEKLLADSEFQDKIATAIGKAILKFRKKQRSINE